MMFLSVLACFVPTGECTAVYFDSNTVIIVSLNIFCDDGIVIFVRFGFVFFLIS